MDISGWIINGFLGLVMLGVLLLIVVAGTMQILMYLGEMNTIPKLLKGVGKGIGSYIVYVIFSCLILLSIWAICQLPFPYTGYIVCFAIGFIVGVVYVASKAKSN